MSSYISLAPYYDQLTRDVDYESFADRYEKIFGMYGKKPKTILDLACGTGTLTWCLAKRGYEMIGTDMSYDMLMAANEKDCDDEGVIRPVFINQSLQELDLFGTSDAAVCSLDGVNYIPPEDLSEVFKRVSLFTEPGGVLIFDINTPFKLQNLDGEICIDETDDVYCVWRTEYDFEEDICYYGMDIFARDGDVWQRTSEEHIEYAYELDELIGVLTENGFSDIRIFNEDITGDPEEGEQRIFISAVNDAIFQQND